MEIFKRKANKNSSVQILKEWLLRDLHLFFIRQILETKKNEVKDPKRIKNISIIRYGRLVAIAECES